MKFQIFTMYVNGRDLLVNAVRSVDYYQDNVVVIDNSLDRHLRPDDICVHGFAGEIHRPPVPLFCSQSYNLISLMAQERDLDAFFIMHSDAEASNEVIENAMSQAEELNRRQVNWGVLFTNYDVLCLCNTSVIKNFQWDQYLPLYYTDVDFYHRLRSAGVELLETGLHVEHVNGGSSTMRSDIALDCFVKTNYGSWRDYYIAKWGGERDQEIFKTPFNQ
jgi:hypothetical protein